LIGVSERSVDVAIIGAGQAGIATSFRLTQRGIDHVVLDAGEVGQTWRTRRWRSFRLVSPNRLNLLPGAEYDGPEPDEFLTTADYLDYLAAYAASFSAPVRSGHHVRALRVREDGRFGLEDHSGTLIARSVVVATGAFGEPWIPPLSAEVPAHIKQLHTDQYWSPESLPDGGVLIVGAGQAGCQIADELALAGRDTLLAVGRFGWVPRRLWGRDQMLWRDDLGDFARVVNDPTAPELTYPFTPMARWGTTDFHVRTLVDDGVSPLGHLRGFDGQTAIFEDDLHRMLTKADEYATKFAGRVFEFARSRGYDIDPEAPVMACWADRPMPTPPLRLDLDAQGIKSIIWASGYRHDFGWIEAATFAANGAPFVDHGMSRVPGLGFMGLHRMHAAASGTILGVNPDSDHVAARIANYLGA
jgi:putative flavoprotein involved in K+ transport